MQDTQDTRVEHYPHRKKLFKALFVLVVILSLYFAVKFLEEIRNYQLIGSSGPSQITLTGHGEVTAVPDIATIYFTIDKSGTTVKEAQDAVAAVEKQALDTLKTDGVADADVQTSDASFNPKYQYTAAMPATMPCPSYGCPPPQANSTIVGYEASESITVKVRNLDSTGTIMQGLGAVGVTDLSGPDFTVDKPDDLQAEARKLAIDDAEAKAKVLAKDLGVHLISISSFSDSGAGYPMPMAFAANAAGTTATSAAAPAQLPTGQNTITSDVTITYDIR